MRNRNSSARSPEEVPYFYLQAPELAGLKAANSKARSPSETALTIARAELGAAKAQFEKSRIRAPLAETILHLPVRVGEPGRSFTRPLFSPIAR